VLSGGPPSDQSVFGHWGCTPALPSDYLWDRFWSTESIDNASLPADQLPIFRAHDYNGNTQTKVVGSNTTTYAWDYENRMSSVTLPGSGGTVTFAYDPFGRRIKKVTSTTTSIYAYDGDNLVNLSNPRFKPSSIMSEWLEFPLNGMPGAFPYTKRQNSSRTRRTLLWASRLPAFCSASRAASACPNRRQQSHSIIPVTMSR